MNANPELSPFEWDFSKVPTDQIEECWTYEFTRECPELIELIQAWRQESSGAGDFGSFKRRAGGVKTGIISVMDKIYLVPIGAYFLFPEWPKMPFQGIEPGERRNRFGALLENEKTIGLPQTERAKAAENAWKDREGSVPNLRKIEPHPAELGVTTLGNWICMPGSVFGKANILRESTDQIVLFRIQWDLADKEILNLFSKWLNANRPRRPLTLGSVGGSDPFREKKKALERLGKVRIVRSRNNDYQSDWQGKALFADQSQWIKCRKSVEGIIARIPVVGYPVPAN